MDRIFLEAISFIGHHGVTQKERAEGRQMLVDVVATFNTQEAAAGDNLASTVDHEILARVAYETGTANSFCLLETLVDRIASGILAATTANSVEVRVRKINPALPGQPYSTGVTIARNRDGEAIPASCFSP